MIDKEPDLEPLRVQWARWRMMAHLFFTSTLLWKTRGRPGRWLAAAIWTGAAYNVFSGTKGIVQSFGPVFWYHEHIREVPGQFTRKYFMSRRIDWRLMIEESPPHRVGKGLAMRLGGKLYMIGYCQRRPPQQNLAVQSGLYNMPVDFWDYELEPD